MRTEYYKWKWQLPKKHLCGLIWSWPVLFMLFSVFWNLTAPLITSSLAPSSSSVAANRRIYHNIHNITILNGNGCEFFFFLLYNWKRKKNTLEHSKHWQWWIYPVLPEIFEVQMWWHGSIDGYASDTCGLGLGQQQWVPHCNARSTGTLRHMPLALQLLCISRNPQSVADEAETPPFVRRPRGSGRCYSGCQTGWTILT